MKGDIAIIGMGCLFPGATSPQAFWDNLLAGRDSTSEATREDLGIDPDLVFEARKGQVDKTYWLRGGFIRDFSFDPTSYHLPAETLAALDQSVQWPLYAADQALRDSGYRDTNLQHCGLILGNLAFPTRSSHRRYAPLYRDSLEAGLRAALASAGGHDENCFHLPEVASSHPEGALSADVYPAAGPALLLTGALGLGRLTHVLDAACASSLYAIDLACRQLLAGKADLMLAGAVSGAHPLMITMGFSIFQAYPEKGESRPLDRASGGLTAGEGAGMVVLKRYADAVRDGDHVYARVRSVGLSNDGSGRHPLIPQQRGQEHAFQRAYQRSGIAPDTIPYIECHATGTPTGDIVELNAMESYFPAPLLCGSVKSNFGHLLTAAGMASVIKVVLAMRHGIIPPTIGVREPLTSAGGTMGGSGIVTANTAWPAGTPRRAGVNAFGFGGTNAHLVLEAAAARVAGPDDNIVGRGREAVPRRSAGGRETVAPALVAAAPPLAVAHYPLAITGMDACFGSAQGLAAFARLSYSGTHLVTDLPPGRWKGVDRQNEVLARYGLHEPPPGAYLDGFELDLWRARVQPGDQPIPQHLLLLQVADRALQDAGMQPGGNVAVVIAMDTDLSLHQYLARVDLTWQIREGLQEAGIALLPQEEEELERVAKDSMCQPGQVNQYMSFIGNIMASRVSALWDFTGPAFTVSAGEQSVYRALEAAELLLAGGEVEAVLLGAVDLAGGVESVLQRNRMRPFAGGPPTLSWDRSNRGPMVGEGAGAIVMRRQDRAARDRVYATIVASSTAPLPSSGSGAATHNAACGNREQLATPGAISPDIGYLSIGTDGPTEEAAEVSGPPDTDPGTDRDRTCALGGAAVNIGHAGVAAPMADLIKAALSLYERYLPGIPGWTGPKLPGTWAEGPLYVPPRSRPWFTRDHTERRAAIRGIASDGTTTYILLAEPVRAGVALAFHPGALQVQVIPVSGESADDLLGALDTLEESMGAGASLASLSHERLSRVGAHSHAYTLSLVAGTADDLRREITRARSGIPAALANGSEWMTPQGSYFTPAPLVQGKVCLVYPGGFSSYLEQGADLFHLVPSLHDHLATLVPHLEEMIADRWTYPRTLEPLSGERLAAREAALLEHPDVATASAGIVAMATTWILRHLLGVQPQSAFGYSLGEATMLWALGIWTDLETAHARFRSWDGLPVEEHARDWKTYLLLDTPERVAAAVAGEPDVYLTIVSTPGEVFIAGDEAACARVMARLDCGHAPAPFRQILHCPAVHPAYEQLAALYRYPLAAQPEIALYSGATYAPLQMDEEAIARSVATVISQPLDFPRLIRRVYDDGARIFVEMGPGSTCARWIRSVLRGRPHVTMSLDQKELGSQVALTRALARLLSHGVPLDLTAWRESLASRFGATAPESHGRALTRRVSLGGPDPRAELAQHAGRFGIRELSQSRAAEGVPATAAPPVPWARPSTAVVALAGHVCTVSETHRVLLAERQNGLRWMTAVIRRQMEHLPLPDEDAGQKSDVVWDEAALLEFAAGKVGNVFGPPYAAIDGYRRRVRLPLPPYLLVHRVTELGAAGHGLRPATITTEYDIPYGAWYANHGQVPVAIAVEAGQCDLLLISYLGVDFDNRGERVYRLLDCTLTFVADLPTEGQTLRYEIGIDSFARSGDNLLFFFHYRCFAGATLLLKMDGGCAGFFSDEDLEQGRGVIDTESERTARAQAVPQYVSPPLRCGRHTFARSDLEALSVGDLAACFGPEFRTGALHNPDLCLPPPAMLMLDRVVSVDPHGGPWGLGVIVAEKDLHPDDWYFPCHFKDDQVLAGSLVAEGCVQLLQFYLLYRGLHLETRGARFQPIHDLPQSVRCRGQITPHHSRLTYRMEIVSLATSPPAARANVDIVVDGKTVVRFTNLGVQIAGRPAQAVGAGGAARRVLFGERQVNAFARGSIVECFGPDFAVYDQRRTPRIPNGDLQFISRVVEVEGTRGDLSRAASLVAEYDVPPDVWFYRERSSAQSIAHPDPPYAVLMEMGLQPCGFLSGWLGSTLHDPETDFYFRNLDGRGLLAQHLDLRGRTVQNRARLLSSTRTAGVIVQSFGFELSCAGQAFYSGDAVFGYFTAPALLQQTGLDAGQETPTWRARHPEMPGRDVDLQHDRRLFRAPSTHPDYRLAGNHLDLLDRAFVAAEGGRHGQGYVEGSRTVRPDDWFFDCHFFQDPVMPGSLGVEAMAEAMQIFALETGGGEHLNRPRFGQAAGEEAIWKYRGQIKREDHEMRLEVHLRDCVREPSRVLLRGDGSLWRDSLRIYEVRNLAVELRES